MFYSLRNLLWINSNSSEVKGNLLIDTQTHSYAQNCWKGERMEKEEEEEEDCTDVVCFWLCTHMCVPLSWVPVNCSCPRAIQPTCSPHRPPMTLPCVNQHMCLSQPWLASYLQGAMQRERCDWKKAAAGHERGPHGVLASAWSRPETLSTVIHARPARPRRHRLNNTLAYTHTSTKAGREKKKCKDKQMICICRHKRTIQRENAWISCVMLYQYSGVRW